MKVIVEFQCEVCRKRYTSQEQAQACESKGKFDPSEYKIGTMFEYHRNGYVGIFAVAKTESFSDNPHLGVLSMWACRTNGYGGDSLGEEKRGSDFIESGPGEIVRWAKYHHITLKGLETPEFDRMVSYLRGAGITPSYWNDRGAYITMIKL